MKPRLYMETTVPSYLTSRRSRDLVSAAHQQITEDWWKARKDDFEIYISQFVLDEAGKGDAESAKRRLEAVTEFKMLDANDEVAAFAAAVLDAGIIPKTSATDAAHIAVAAVHSMDYLLTWNCAHIANAEIFRAVAEMCRSRGYNCPVICTPEELLGG